MSSDFPSTPPQLQPTNANILTPNTSLNQLANAPDILLGVHAPESQTPSFPISFVPQTFNISSTPTTTSNIISTNTNTIINTNISSSNPTPIGGNTNVNNSHSLGFSNIINRHREEVLNSNAFSSFDSLENRLQLAPVTPTQQSILSRQLQFPNSSHFFSPLLDRSSSPFLHRRSTNTTPIHMNNNSSNNVNSSNNLLQPVFSPIVVGDQSSPPLLQHQSSSDLASNLGNVNQNQLAVPIVSRTTSANLSLSPSISQRISLSLQNPNQNNSLNLVNAPTTSTSSTTTTTAAATTTTNTTTITNSTNANSIINPTATTNVSNLANANNTPTPSNLHPTPNSTASPSIVPINTNIHQTNNNNNNNNAPTTNPMIVTNGGIMSVSLPMGTILAPHVSSAAIFASNGSANSAHLEANLERQKLKQSLQQFWKSRFTEFSGGIDGTTLPKRAISIRKLTKMMKEDEDVHRLAQDTPKVLEAACELFVMELTTRAWHHTQQQSNKRKTIQKIDLARAISEQPVPFDFLADVVPEEIELHQRKKQKVTQTNSMDHDLPSSAAALHNQNNNNNNNNNNEQRPIIPRDHLGRPQFKALVPPHLLRQFDKMATSITNAALIAVSPPTLYRPNPPNVNAQIIQASLPNLVAAQIPISLTNSQSQQPQPSQQQQQPIVTNSTPKTNSPIQRTVLIGQQQSASIPHQINPITLQ